MKLDVSGCQGFKAMDENIASQENFESGTQISLCWPGFLNLSFNFMIFGQDYIHYRELSCAL